MGFKSVLYVSECLCACVCECVCVLWQLCFNLAASSETRRQERRGAGHSPSLALSFPLLVYRVTLCPPHLLSLLGFRVPGCHSFNFAILAFSLPFVCVCSLLAPAAAAPRASAHGRISALRWASPTVSCLVRRPTSLSPTSARRRAQSSFFHRLENELPFRCVIAAPATPLPAVQAQSTASHLSFPPTSSFVSGPSSNLDKPHWQAQGFASCPAHWPRRRPFRHLQSFVRYHHR